MNECDEKHRLPLTWAQEAYWMGFHAAKAFRAEWVILADQWKLPPDTLLTRLMSALQEIVDGSEMLRTRFSKAMDPPAQYIHRSVDANLVLCGDSEFESCFHAMRKRGFDIVSEFPYAIIVAHRQGLATHFGMVAHHIILDWEGMQAIRNRVTLAMNGTPIAPTVSTQHLVDDEAATDRNELAAYWRSCIASAPNTLFPARTLGRDAEHSLVTGTLISSTLGRRIDEAAKQYQATHTSVIMASVVRAVGELTTASSLSMNLVVSNRRRATRDGVLHAATVSLTGPLHTNQPYKKSVVAAGRSLFDSLRHAKLPASDVRQIIEEEAERRSVRASVEITLNFYDLNDASDLPPCRELSVARRSIDSGSPWIDITCSKRDGGTKISVEFSSLKISDSEVQRFLRVMDDVRGEDAATQGAVDPDGDLQWLEDRHAWTSRSRLKNSILSVPGVVGLEFAEPWAAVVDDVRVRLFGDGSSAPPSVAQLRDSVRFDPCAVPVRVEYIGFCDPTPTAVDLDRRVDDFLTRTVELYVPDLDLERNYFAQGGRLLDLAPLVHQMQRAGYGGADASLFEWRSVAEALVAIQQ